MAKNNEWDAFYGGMAAGGFLICVVWGITSLFTQPADLDNGFRQGYCLAQGAEIISDDICAKDGQIITIPPRP